MINNYYKLGNKYHKKIALLSDIHYSKRYDSNLFLKILSNLKENKPDYICIAGDIVDDESVLNIPTARNRLKKFIEHLGTIGKVIIIPGNHDLEEITNGKVVPNYNKDYYECLNELNNVYYLNNKNILLDQINFIGWNVGLDYYDKYREKNIDILLKEWQNVSFKIKKGKYNVLLFHSPIHMLDKEMIENMEGIQLVLSGHMHNGLVFPILEKIKSNKGLIGPFKNLFPKLARGIKSCDEKGITLVISGGILKLSEKTRLTKLNFLFDTHIEYIEI